MRDRHQPLQLRRFSQGDRHVRRAPGHPHQQAEHQHAAQQMAHHHDGFEQQGHRPHAQQGLEDHHRQGQQRRTCEIDVAPAQRGDQQDRLAGQGQGTGGAVPAHHVQRYAGGHQHAGGHHRRASESSLARGQQRQGQDLDAQRAGQEAMHLFSPGLVGLQRADLRRRVADGLFHVLRPSGLAIAGRPVRAAQAGIGQAHEGAEHDRARGHDHGEPRQAVEIAVQRRTRGKAHQTGLTSVSATWPCPCAGHRGRNPGHGA